MTRFLLSALGLSAALISAMPAAAQDEISVHVSYADLDLSSNAGVAVFKQRLDGAVTQICGTANIRNLGAMSLVRACRQSTSAMTERQMRQVIASAQAPRSVTLAKADPAR